MGVSSLTAPGLWISSPRLFPSFSLDKGAERGGKRHMSLGDPLKREFQTQHLVGTSSGDPESSISHLRCALVYFHYEPVFTKLAQH